LPGVPKDQIQMTLNFSVTSVTELRSIPERDEKAGGYLDLFDGFVREAELGLALHAICDYLLEPDAPLAEGTVIENIQALHSSMELEDDCVD